jgi:hypothetical protein
VAKQGLTEEDKAILLYTSTQPTQRCPRYARIGKVASELYPDLAGMTEEQLLAEYYVAPILAQRQKLRSQKAKQKTRAKLLALAKNRERWAGSPARRSVECIFR